MNINKVHVQKKKTVKTNFSCFSVARILTYQAQTYAVVSYSVSKSLATDLAIKIRENNNKRKLEKKLTRMVVNIIIIRITEISIITYYLLKSVWSDKDMVCSIKSKLNKSLGKFKIKNVNSVDCTY